MCVETVSCDTVTKLALLWGLATQGIYDPNKIKKKQNIRTFWKRLDVLSAWRHHRLSLTCLSQSTKHSCLSKENKLILFDVLNEILVLVFLTALLNECLILVVAGLRHDMTGHHQMTHGFLRIRGDV